MSLQRTSQTSANGLAAKSLLCDVIANLRQHLEHKVDLERAIELWDLRFREL
jgi:hypothetical protein